MLKTTGKMGIVIALGLGAYGCDLDTGRSDRDADAYPDDDDRIVDGVLNEGDPAVAFVLIELNDGRSFSCSGSLITPQTVLFAAHCVQFGNIRPEDITDLVAYFGNDAQEFFFGSGNDPSFIASEAATSLRIHPEWNEVFEDGNDLAVMILDREINGVDPVRLNSTPLESFMLPGDRVRAAGFGNSEVDFFSGNSSGPAVKQEGTSTLIDFDQQHILTFGFGPEAQVCRGDSGGPTFAEVPGQGELQIAVTSFEPDVSLRCDSEAKNVRVDTHLDWIEAAADPDTLAQGLEIRF